RAADLAADGSLTGPHRFNFFIWYQDLPMAIPGLVRREAVVLGRLNAARMALAVEQFRESEGRLPQTNAELSGRQSTARLTDPLTGEPLAFQRLENGYRTGTKEQLKQPGKTRGRSAGAQGVEFTVPR
ncbi:MAG TPA: hypothetical protein VHH73_01135, partial [Verrucomicrobiae bacterium]|nr:hypothetical protein [Verrucomicrobiae bacterium]